jgi:hypothetical protein
MEVALVLQFIPDLAALLETPSGTILQASQASFQRHLAFYSLNFMSSTRASCWPKTYVLMNLSVILIFYIVSTSSSLDAGFLTYVSPP